MRSLLFVLLVTVPLFAQETPRFFKPARRPALPVVKDTTWATNPIDTFILARQEAKGLAPNRTANRLRLLRRVTFDLTGLPPSIEEQEAFLGDPSPDAYTKLVTRLLSSPRFGERYAQHWLDLVRYAESDGFKEDAIRPDAHRYRDWVIGAINAKMPYDQFVGWQLAGDELAPDNPEALVATGFNRLWPDEYNAANLEQRRQEILDDNTDTAGLAFMGLTVGCARCHDHKFDPISQREYFRLQAFFSPMQPRELPAVDAATLEAYRAKRAEWEKETLAIRKEMEDLVGKKREQERLYALDKFREEIKQAVRTPPAKRTPYEWQIALMAEKQMDRAGEGVHTKLPEVQKKRYLELQSKLLPAPKAPPTAMTVRDIGTTPPPTHRLMGGDWRKPAAEVQPGFPKSLGEGVVDTRLPVGVVSTGRRAALARWLTRPEHPLTARVIVNRLWQHHFGVGLVATSSDFGVQGTPPTHPELLDWLACELVESGWDLAHIHRLMVTSAVYQQDSQIDPRNPMHARGLAVDRDNDLLWHARRQRLEGEAIRDALLTVTGEMNTRMHGRSARPELPAAFGKAAWKPDDKVHDQHRRSVYVLAKRNLRYPLFDAFDYPDMHNSCSRRLNTTTAPQALLLLNSELTIDLARQWAKSIHARQDGNTEEMIKQVYRRAWGREPSKEIELAEEFLAKQASLYREEGASDEQAQVKALVDFCHAVLNTNEFVYVD